MTLDSLVEVLFRGFLERCSFGDFWGPGVVDFVVMAVEAVWFADDLTVDIFQFIFGVDASIIFLCRHGALALPVCTGN